MIYQLWARMIKYQKLESRVYSNKHFPLCQTYYVIITQFTSFPAIALKPRLQYQYKDSFNWMWLLCTHITRTILLKILQNTVVDIRQSQ